MSNLIEKSIENGVLQILINRPQKKNALTADMYQTLADTFNSVNLDPEVRVVYIRANGDAFCAGNDLADFLQIPPTDTNAPVFQFMQALLNTEKPVVAAVNGLAVGIGTTMLLHCDAVYASDDAVFNLPFVQLGLCPEFGSSLLLPLLCGRQKAADLLLNPRSFDAQEANALGLITQVTRVEALHTRAREAAETLAKQSPAASVVTKRLMTGALRPQLDEVIARESEEFIALLQTEEVKRTLSAFLN